MSREAEKLPLLATDAGNERVSNTRATSAIDGDGALLTPRGGSRNISRNTIILASVAASCVLLLLCIGISLSDNNAQQRTRTSALSLSRDISADATDATTLLASAHATAAAREENVARLRSSTYSEQQEQHPSLQKEGQMLRQQEGIASHAVPEVSRLGSDADAQEAAWNQPPAIGIEGEEPKEGEEKPFYQYTLVTHVLAIGINTEGDVKNIKYLRKWLSAENRMDFIDLDRYLEHTPGIDAGAWPEKFEDAEYAVCDIERELEAKGVGDDGEPVATLGNMYYVNAIQQAREAGNTLTEGFKGIAHHVGCMYAHLYQWQYAWDKQYADAVVLESDAPWLLGVPAFSLQDIVNHQPFDYDIIFIVHREFVAGEYLYSFNSHGPEYDKVIHMYRWNSVPQAAGLQGYVMNRRMKPKIVKYMAHTMGMDMVDAWLMTRVCSEVQPDTGKYALNCYHATTQPPEGEEVVMRDADVKGPSNGYVRLGRYELNSYPEDAAIPYDFGDEEPIPAPSEEEDDPDEEADDTEEPKPEPESTEPKSSESAPESTEPEPESTESESSEPESESTESESSESESSEQPMESESSESSKNAPESTESESSKHAPESSESESSESESSEQPMESESSESSKNAPESTESESSESSKQQPESSESESSEQPVESESSSESSEPAAQMESESSSESMESESSSESMESESSGQEPESTESEPASTPTPSNPPSTPEVVADPELTREGLLPVDFNVMAQEGISATRR